MKYFKEVNEEDIQDIFEHIDDLKELILNCKDKEECVVVFSNMLKRQYEVLANYYVGGVNYEE